MERKKLNEGQIAEHLMLVPGWKVLDGKLTKSYDFKSYASGVLFAVAVANAADHMDHHPDLTIGYQRVTVAVNTHDVGGISPFDFDLARKADASFES